MAFNGAEDIDAEAAECAVYAFQSDVKGILLRMQGTVSGLLQGLRPLAPSTPLFTLEQVAEYLRNHLRNAGDAAHVICALPILTESKAKAAMALVVHRPCLFFVKEHLLSDLRRIILEE